MTLHDRSRRKSTVNSLLDIATSPRKKVENIAKKVNNDSSNNLHVGTRKRRVSSYVEDDTEEEDDGRHSKTVGESKRQNKTSQVKAVSVESSNRNVMSDGSLQWCDEERNALSQVHALIPLHSPNYWELIAHELFEAYYIKNMANISPSYVRRSAEECYTEWYKASNTRIDLSIFNFWLCYYILYTYVDVV
jgi:hypothetical protein